MFAVLLVAVFNFVVVVVIVVAVVMAAQILESSAMEFQEECPNFGQTECITVTIVASLTHSLTHIL